MFYSGKIFHQGFHIATIVDDDRSISIIRTDTCPLAEKTLSSTPGALALLSVDTSNTPVSVARKGGGVSGESFSAYGYDPVEDRGQAVTGFTGESVRVFRKYLLGNYRIYDPALMRFHSPDNLSPFAAGSINCYGYCSGDPINNTDPTGHFRNPIKFFRNLLSHKRRTFPNAKLSQPTPVHIQLPEYTQPSSFNPAFKNIGNDFQPSKLQLKFAKRLAENYIAAGVPTAEDLARYEPSAPRPVNIIYGENAKYFDQLERRSKQLYKLARQPRDPKLSRQDHRESQAYAYKTADAYSEEMTNMLFEPGYAPSATNLAILLRY